MSDELDKAREALAYALTPKCLRLLGPGSRFACALSAGHDGECDRWPVLSVKDSHLRAALADVDRLTAALAEAEATIANERAASEQRDTEAWTRGFFMALATHADDAGREEGIATTNIRTVKQAIAAGVEEQDAEKLRRRFAVVRELELDLKKRAAARAAMRAATKEQG